MPPSTVPFAVQRMLPERQPHIGVRGVILHSIVGSAEAAYGKFLNSSSLESTFILKKDGTLFQIMDADERADANGAGNIYYASVETEDNGDPNNDPWTPAQIDRIVQLLHWYRDNYGVPMVPITANGGRGVGFHVMSGDTAWGNHRCRRGPDAFNWTEVRGKTCPGCIRQDQFWNEVLPRAAGGIVDDMPSIEELRALQEEDHRWWKAENDRIIQDRAGRLHRINTSIKAILTWAKARFGSAPSADA